MTPAPSNLGNQELIDPLVALYPSVIARSRVAGVDKTTRAAPLIAHNVRAGTSEKQGPLSPTLRWTQYPK